MVKKISFEGKYAARIPGKNKVILKKRPLHKPASGIKKVYKIKKDRHFRLRMPSRKKKSISYSNVAKELRL